MSPSDLLDHSELGPSGASRWLACPGSVQAQRAVPDDESWYAAEGTAAHTLSEWAREHECSAERWLGETIRFPRQSGDGDWEFEVTAEMAQAVDEFCEYVNGLPGDAHYELRVGYTEWVPGGFGTADDIRLGATCYVTDLKYGKGVPVAAEDNPQLKMYALGVLQEFDWAYEFERFVLTISQPRIGVLDTFEITREALLEWANSVVGPAAEEALGPDPSFAAGGHCRFCRVRESCTTRARYVLGVFSASDPDRQMLTEEDVGELYPFLGQIKAWCDDVESLAVKMLHDGAKVPGLKLVEGRRSREWVDAEKADKALARKAKLKQTERFQPRKVISPAAAEKVLGKQHPLLQDVEAGGLVVNNPGRPTLAPASDRRPALQPAIEFDDLTEPEGGSLS